MRNQTFRNRRWHEAGRERRSLYHLEALNKDGYKLSVDGVVGKHTRGAIKDFQRKNDLKVTGAPDTETLAKLNLKQPEQNIGEPPPVLWIGGPRG